MIGHKKVLTACFAALLGLGLAACGTTGEDAALVIEPDPTPEMVAATDAVIAMALAEYGTAKTAYDDAKTAYDDDMTLATAMALQAAATDMQIKAAAASTAAENGAAEQMTMAATAVSDAEAAVGDAGQILAAVAMVAATDALAEYGTAKTAYDDAKTAYDDDMTLATAMALQAAATDMQIKAAAASTAAENGAAEQMTMAATAVSDAEAAVGDAGQILAAVAMVAATDALAEYGNAKTAYGTAKTAYDGDMTLATAMALQAAATDMQIKAAAASTAAENGTAEQMTMAATAVSDAEAAVGAAVQILAAAQRDADIDAGIAAQKAIAEYHAARLAFDNAFTAYGAKDANVDDATELVALAEAAQTKAMAAQMYANAGGTAEQVTAAGAAVTAAYKAVMYANSERTQAMTTAATTLFDAKIMTQSTTPAVFVVKATRETDDVMVTVKGGAIAADAMDIAEGAAADLGNGWFRADVADDDDVQTATVFTNIENTMEKFTNIHTVDNAAIGGISTATGVLQLTADNAEQRMAWNTYVSADAFPGPNPDVSSQTVTFDGSTDDPKQFPGTFDGVLGTYECTTAGDCTATADGKGALTSLDGTWTFTPDYFGEDGESVAGENVDQVATREDDLPEPSVAVEDEDYLQFGWWTEMDDGDVEFQTFFGGAEEFIVTNIAGLEGTAIYKGPAAGRYAVKAFNSNATIDSIRHGVFTAAATLTAKFGGRSIAADEHDTITGEIAGFAGQNGDDLSAWSVTLMEADRTDLNVGVFTGMAGGALGGSPVNNGEWKGQFFGNGAVPTDHPNSVAGEFNAQSSHGAVAGAFGAERTDD